MIERLNSQNESQFYINVNNGPHKLLFEHEQKINPDEYTCTLINYLGNKIDLSGTIILTDFRVIFKISKDKQQQEEKIKFDFPLGYLTKCESSSQLINKALVFYVEFHLKFGFMLKVKSFSSELNKISEHINGLIGQYDRFGENRASDLSPNQKCKKWQQICFGKEGKIDEAVNYDNEAWKFLPTYPQFFKVPKPFVGKRNQHDRIVLLSYVYQSKKAIGLWKNGPGKPDPEQQKWVPTAAKKSDHIVVQIKNKAVGTNKSLAQRMIQMDGPIQLRESFMKFFIVSCYQNQQKQQTQRWLINANFSRWYQQAQVLISQTFLLIQKMNHGINITILSEWDVRSSQICALIQLLVKPENRTISGFGRLIQKQFLHFGHYTPAGTRKQRLQDKGIGLIQFLQCVYQISKMYPLSFQFNEQMLTYIAIHIYSRKYGNFLYLTRSTSQLNQQKFVKYGCIWAKIQKFKQQFTNPFFVDYRQSDVYELKKNVGMKNYSMWATFFLRDILMYSNNVQMNQLSANQRILWKKHSKLRQETQALRIKISQQHKLINQKRKKLKQLQRLQLD